MHATTLPRPPYRVALVGAGAVGTAVSLVLRSRSHSISAVWSRTPSSAQRAGEVLATDVAATPEEAVRGATLVLIGAVDHAIAPLAHEVAAGVSAGAVVVHFAGSLGTQPLEAAARSGARAAALHPVQALPDVATALDRLSGSAWGVTADDDVATWSERFVEDEMGGQVVHVDEGDRPLWHAAAVSTSNGIAAVTSTGMAILSGLGIAAPADVLGPLAAGTVANVVARGGSGDAFTGPVVRGDAATIARHLDGLRARAPELLDEYVSVARAIVAGAARAGRLDASTHAAMATLLEAS